MADVCGGKTEPPPPVRRNGMDFQPKKTYPPDYSNVPSVRDWQMSPFGNERYDLDEIQKAEKKGFKGRFKLAKLKEQLADLKEGKRKERKEEEKKKKKAAKLAETQMGRGNYVRCSVDYLYQPYGPSVPSMFSYSRPDMSRPKLYNYLGPSFYSGYRFKVPAPEMVSPIPCPDHCRLEPPRVFTGAYMPYGPYGELRVTPNLYTPLGPTVYSIF